ncbi:glutamic acid-rich protein-like isoform X2 [Asparagus officinalis]|nr:glutamic acid-rich protein-like isoform X2 [Asparagus officinalis]XP_020262067.1 glutamic acid-rich protein-like isoform X2 [Asparagus officinalis]XP_020262068.1 glutamic acid-rich protein-like isoform X2 [Asparagus officinalis]XP_020262069.1 glutamic acid-rich protein-like isoform X2 [Asparagus officinalis]XP_020262070.1 glutamic acid-rich protein-like isoform X2 [Asparagus officinalis]
MEAERKSLSTSSKQKRSFEVMSTRCPQVRPKEYNRLSNMDKLRKHVPNICQLPARNIAIQRKELEERTKKKMIRMRQSREEKMLDEIGNAERDVRKKFIDQKGQSSKTRQQLQNHVQIKVIARGEHSVNLEDKEEDIREDFIEDAVGDVSEHDEQDEEEDRGEDFIDESEGGEDFRGQPAREVANKVVDKPKKYRGQTKCQKVHARSVHDRHVIFLNECGQPIGPSDKACSELSSFLGTLGRNSSFAPLDKENWHKVEEKDKEKIWDYVKEKYYIPKEGRKWTLETVNCAWRRWKSFLKKKCFDGFKNDKQRMKTRPDTIPEIEFKALLKFWNTEQSKITSETNKANRDGQEYIHTTGSISFARIHKKLENELGRSPSEAEMFIETHKRNTKPQGEKIINLIGALEELKSQDEDDDAWDALEELKSQDEDDDAWDLVKKDEHLGRVRLMGRGVTKTMLQNKYKKIVDPYEQVPESIVQNISQKVEQELTKKFEAQKVDLVHGFAELLTETIGQTIDPAAIARLVARTRSPEQANSARNHDRPRSSGSSHHPRNEEN